MDIESVFPAIVPWLEPLGITDTVAATWLILAVILAFGLITRNRYEVWEPKGWQRMVEWVVNYVESLIMDSAGRPLPELVPYLSTMIVFVAIANLLGLLPGLQAPTRDINTTAALAIIALFSWQIYGIRVRGFMAWLKSFVEPNPIMLPFNLLGIFSRVLSMALRLFGNVIAGEVIGAVMFGLLPFLGPILFNLLGSITGVLQALVFTVLTLVFLVDAAGETAAEADAAAS